MQGIPDDVVRKITGHRSRELERYQHLSPLFRAQTVDLIAQVLVSDTPTDAPAPEEEQDDANLFENGGVDGTRRPSVSEAAKERPPRQIGASRRNGGVDGTRTRDLRRDRPAF
jgi:hypothetical protein